MFSLFQCKCGCVLSKVDQQQKKAHPILLQARHYPLLWQGVCAFTSVNTPIKYILFLSFLSGCMYYLPLISLPPPPLSLLNEWKHCPFFWILFPPQSGCQDFFKALATVPLSLKENLMEGTLSSCLSVINSLSATRLTAPPHHPPALSSL